MLTAFSVPLMGMGAVSKSIKNEKIKKMNIKLKYCMLLKWCSQTEFLQNIFIVQNPLLAINKCSGRPRECCLKLLMD